MKDLEKTLKNIEEARPFEDLTVVCIAGLVMEMIHGTNVLPSHRMKSQLLVQILTRRLLNSFLRDAGLYQATRYDF